VLLSFDPFRPPVARSPHRTETIVKR
jgi:hypothetical protein